MALFGRLVTAMVTPFDQQLQIDYDKTERLIEHLLTTGTEALVVSGTTGESPTLSFPEKLQLFRHVKQYVNGRCQVIAGTGSNNTACTIELTQAAQEAGVDGIMLVTPYYSKTSQEGLYQHFKTIAEATKLPIMLYNIPSRSAVNMTLSTLLRLAEIPNIVCVKEASADLTHIAKIIEHAPAGFEVYSGDDALTLPILSIGGVGVVSVTAHVVGKEMTEMMQAFFAGDATKAARIHRKLMPIYEGMFAYPNPVPTKTALEALGVEVGGVRLPLVDLNEQEKQFVQGLFP